MIPTPLNCVKEIDLKDKSYGYKRLISYQYSYINIKKNKDKILDKAEKIYNIVSNSKSNKKSNFYKKLSCNFKLLEEKSKKYLN